MRLLILIVALLLAGCVESRTASSEAEHRFGGSFTANATQENIDDFRHRMQAHNGSTIIMESFPPQFRVDDFGFTDCAKARNEARSLRYILSTTDCEAVRPVTGNDEPTSTGTTNSFVPAKYFGVAG